MATLIVKTGAVENQNEITEFLNMRYQEASECCLEILKILFHYRTHRHPVLKLACHVPNQHMVCCWGYEEVNVDNYAKN